MGDANAEPSMEEILSSIKRIIAEEGDAATGARARRVREAPSHDSSSFADEQDVEPAVLELREAVAATEAPSAEATPEPILSQQAVEATRQPLEALSRIVVKPEVAGSDTLEGLVRALLKPMLRDWLDANLPQIVEAMVAREISRITGGR